MFNLFKKSSPRQPRATIITALTADGLKSSSPLSVVERNGSYSGRSVTYFRVFDASRVADRGLQVRDFPDLDTHADLILGEGHVEREGAVVLSRRTGAAEPTANAYSRSEANREAHGDDEQFVFPDKH